MPCPARQKALCRLCLPTLRPGVSFPGQPPFLCPLRHTVRHTPALLCSMHRNPWSTQPAVLCRGYGNALPQPYRPRLRQDPAHRGPCFPHACASTGRSLHTGGAASLPRNSSERTTGTLTQKGKVPLPGGNLFPEASCGSRTARIRRSSLLSATAHRTGCTPDRPIRMSAHDAPHVPQAGAPVIAGQAVNAHTLAAARAVDETAVADIESRMQPSP